MDNSLIGRHIDATVLLGGGKAEHVVVLIDSATYRAKGVVAVGHRIRDRELVKAACPGSLDDTDIRDVVGCHSVESDAQFRSFGCLCVVGPENLVSDCFLASLVFAGQSFGILDNRLSVKEIHSMLDHFYHNCVVLRILVN